MLGHFAFRFCPRCSEHEGLDILPFIGILSHGFSIRCLRFVPPSRATTQDSLQCGDHPFTVGLFHPLGSTKRFSCDLLYVISLPPRFLRFHGATEQPARKMPRIFRVRLRSVTDERAERVRRHEPAQTGVVPEGSVTDGKRDACPSCQRDFVTNRTRYSGRSPSD